MEVWCPLQSFAKLPTRWLRWGRACPGPAFFLPSEAVAGTPRAATGGPQARPGVKGGQWCHQGLPCRLCALGAGKRNVNNNKLDFCDYKPYNLRSEVSKVAKSKIERIPAYTVSAAAAELGVTAPRIYQWLDDGTLKEVGPLRGNSRWVDAKSVLDLKHARENAALSEVTD